MNEVTGSLVPSFVVFQVGLRRVALSREGVAELIASPLVYSFPHTTPLIRGVVFRRGRILPVLDLGPGVLGAPSPATRFFLVVERGISNMSERCAIPVQGECELVTGNLLPETRQDGIVTGYLDVHGAQVEVLDLDRAIAASTVNEEEAIPATEAML
jgi:chemotaxis signal transduction protein